MTKNSPGKVNLLDDDFFGRENAALSNQLVEIDAPKKVTTFEQGIFSVYF